MNTDIGTIYMVQASPSGLVKIGYSGDLTRRIRVLMTGNSERIAVLATFWGTPGMERRAHEVVAADCHHGEWFSPTAAVLALADCRDSIAFLSAVGLGDGFSFRKSPLRRSIEAAMRRAGETVLDDYPAPAPPLTWPPDAAAYWGEWTDLLTPATRTPAPGEAVS